MKGLRWVALGRGASEVFAFAAAVTLARLISPAEFGRAAVPLALVPLAVIMTFEGCASALVQRKTITETDQRSALVLSLLAGFLLFGLVLLFARTGAEPLFGSRSAHLLAFASPVFVIAGFGAVPRAMLWRRLDFRRVTIVEVISLATGAIVSITLAFAGVNAEALIAGALAATAVSSILLNVAAPCSVGRPSRRSIRTIAGFGIPAALAGLIGVAVTSASYVILAARTGPTQTGLYWRAFQLGVSYQEKVSGIMVRVAFPVYSRTKDPVELRRVHERATRVHATVIVPLLTLLIALAPLLIPWLLGSAWEDAIRPTQVLAVAGMASALLTGYPQVMLGVGRPQALLRFNVVMLALYIGVVTVTSANGLMTVCIGVVAVQLIQLAAVYVFLLRPYLGVPVRRLFTDPAAAIGASAVLLAVAEGVEHVLVSLGAPVPATLVGTSVIGAIAYAIALRSLLPSRLGRRRRARERPRRPEAARRSPPRGRAGADGAPLMCGIAGQVRSDGGAVDREQVEAMCAALEHRGPDARGLHLEGSVGLGIRRLARHRPRDRRSADRQRGRHRRGRPQRRDLQLPRARDASSQARGHRFATDGDTEVIVAPLRGARRPTASTHLRGMFAFALWDEPPAPAAARARPARQEAALLRSATTRLLRSPPSLQALLCRTRSSARGRSRRRSTLPQRTATSPRR